MGSAQLEGLVDTQEGEANIQERKDKLQNDKVFERKLRKVRMQEAKQEKEKQNRDIQHKRNEQMGSNTENVSLRNRKQWSPCLQCKEKKIRMQETKTELEVEEN